MHKLQLTCTNYDSHAQTITHTNTMLCVCVRTCVRTCVCVWEYMRKGLWVVLTVVYIEDAAILHLLHLPSMLQYKNDSLHI